MTTNVQLNTESAATRGFDASLVALYNSQDLLNLARDKSNTSREKLIKTLSGIFDAKLGYSELEIASDIVISLVKQAEVDLRATLAKQFSENENLPLRLALTFANDEYIVAQPILEKSPVLNDLDLMYIIQAKGADYWSSIAKRGDLGAVTIKSLSEKRDEKTALSLLENKDITLPEASCAIFMEMSKQSNVLAMPLTQRAELPSEIVRELYSIVGKELQQKLTAQYGDISKEMGKAQEELSSTLAQNDAVAPTVPQDISATRILEALRLGRGPSFKALFSAYSGLKVCMVETLLKQKGGRGLAIVCKARRMDRSDFMTLYMLKSSLINGTKVVDHGDLSKALTTFDRISMDFATKMHAKAMSSMGAFSLT